MLTGDINCSPKDLVDWCLTSFVFVSGMICQSEFDVNIYIYIDFDYGHASDRYRAIVRTVK